jgi:RNase adaptor protein for sRNA GlmZ degradation
LARLFKEFEEVRRGYPLEVVELRHMLVRCNAQEKQLKELQEPKDWDMMGKTAKANKLAKLLDSCLEKNRELLP